MVVKAYKASPLGRINFSMFDYSACLVREEWRVSRVCHYPTGVEPGVGGGGHPGWHGLQSGVLVGLLDRLLGRYCRGCWEGARWACWLVRRFRWVEGWHGAGFGGCACLGGCSGLGAGVLGSNRFGVGSGGAGRGCAHRRHDRPLDPVASQHEALGRLELVPAQLPPLAAGHSSGCHRACRSNGVRRLELRQCWRARRWGWVVQTHPHLCS